MSRASSHGCLEAGSGNQGGRRVDGGTSMRLPATADARAWTDGGTRMCEIERFSPLAITASRSAADPLWPGARRVDAAQVVRGLGDAGRLRASAF